MNPMKAAQNRSKRLAAEAATPVYSTATGQPNPFHARAMQRREAARDRYAAWIAEGNCGCGDC
jgi:hypothetical protein